MSMGAEIAILLALILVNGFFSLSEMSIVSSRKARLREKADRGQKGAKLALETAMEPSKFLSTVQVVITLIGILAGAFGGATVAEKLARILESAGMSDDPAQTLAYAIVVVATTFLSVVFGELVPKSIALSRPEAIASFVAFPMRFFSALFMPIVKVLSASTNLTVRLVGVKAGEEPPVTEEEVKVLIAQGTETGVFDEREKRMFEGVLYLGDRRVTTFMTPRTDIVYIDKDEPAEVQLEKIMGESTFSRLPIVDGDLDHVLGMLPIKKILAARARGGFSELDRYIEQPLFVPESLGALDLFTRFRETGTRAAMIVDEYGGVAGLVTFSDLAEAILGDVADAGAGQEPDIVRRDDGSMLVDGSLSVDALCERLGIRRETIEGDFETVAGFVLDKMGSIPRTGESLIWNSWKIEIVDMDGNRIDKLLVTPPAQLGEEWD